MRRWWALLVAGVAVAVIVPLAWWVTRPTGSEGAPVTWVRAPARTPSPATPGTATGTGAAVTVTARAATPVTGGRVPRPVELTIAAIAVRAAVDPVGVLADGSMVIPREVDRIGWYRFGPAPGARSGAAVLAGHVDSEAQGAGALFRLREVGVGDRIVVRRQDGTRLTYRVTGKETLVKKRLPTERLFARDGPPRLVLITCGGPFIRELSSYRDNLVVVAEPVAGAP